LDEFGHFVIPHLNQKEKFLPIQFGPIQFGFGSVQILLVQS